MSYKLYRLLISCFTLVTNRAALEEVKMDLQERSQRWAQIESICGFPIKQNPGQICLEALLRAAGHGNYSGTYSIHVRSNDTQIKPAHMEALIKLASYVNI